jgi:mannose-6-phosphate isomerase-like protein (cupin superfamily)
MSLKDYIDSGMIEDYCLGLLTPDEMEEVTKQANIHPEIKERINEYQSVLKQYAAELTPGKAKSHKKHLMEIIDNLETETGIDIKNLPLISKYSDSKKWLPLAKSVLPSALEEPTLTYVLRDEKGINQFLIWTIADSPYELHEDVFETLLLLEGECICRVGEDAYHLTSGGFLTIPLHKQHNLEVVNGPVLLLVQRLEAA